MDAIRRFWRQPSTHYRNFQIVCTVLALHFLVPAALYLVAPGHAIEQFSALNQWLGGAAYQAPEAQSYFFRFLGIANVAAMGWMCIWMQRDLRNRSGVLAPLVVLKGLAALLWAGGYFAGPGAPAMGVAALFDFGICAVITGFTVAARSDIHRLSDGALVPEPVGTSELEWLGFEQRWVESILDATIPPRPEDDLPGFSEVELGDFWEEFLEHVPLHFRFGLRVSTWLITFWPILTFRSIRTFHGLSDDRKDEVLSAVEHSNFFVIRQATFVFKTTAGFAYFRDPSMQRRFPGAYRKFAEEGGDAKRGASEPSERRQ